MSGLASSKASVCPEFAIGRNVALCNTNHNLGQCLGLEAALALEGVDELFEREDPGGRRLRGLSHEPDALHPEDWGRHRDWCGESQY